MEQCLRTFLQNTPKCWSWIKMCVRIIQIWFSSFSSALSSISWESQKEARIFPKLEEWNDYEACLNFCLRKEILWIDLTWYSRILRTLDEIYFFIIILHIRLVSRLRGKGNDRCDWLRWSQASSIWFLWTLTGSLAILWLENQREGFRNLDISVLSLGIFPFQDLEFDKICFSKASIFDSLIHFLWSTLSFGHRIQHLFMFGYWW